MGIRYLVVTQRLAPAPFSTEVRPTPRGFLATLDAQLDLEPLDVPAGLVVYRNQAAFPVRAALPLDPPPPIDGGIADAADTDLSAAEPVLTREAGHLTWKGEVGSQRQVLVSEASSDRWQLRVDGRTIDSDKSFGWATGYVVEDGGPATLRYRTPIIRYAMLLVQALVWLVALRALVRIRLTRPPATQRPAFPALPEREEALVP
jgi:hypothetical protein